MWSPAPKSVLLSTRTCFKKAHCQRTFQKRVSPSKPAQPGHPWGLLGGWLSRTSGQRLHLCSGSCKTSREVTCRCPVPAGMAMPPSSWTTPLWSGPTPSPLHLPNPTRTSPHWPGSDFVVQPSQWGAGGLLPQAAPRQLRINNLWCIEFL